MIPNNTLNNSTKMGCAYAEKVSERSFFSPANQGEHFASKDYSVLRELGVVNLFSRFVRGKLKSAASYGVGVVCFCISCVEMVGIAAKRVVTFVADVRLGRWLSVCKNVGNSMCWRWELKSNRLGRNIGIPVPRWLFVPKPTLRRIIGFLNASPKASFECLCVSLARCVSCSDLTFFHRRSIIFRT